MNDTENNSYRFRYPFSGPVNHTFTSGDCEKIWGLIEARIKDGPKNGIPPVFGHFALNAIARHNNESTVKFSSEGSEFVTITVQLPPGAFLDSDFVRDAEVNGINLLVPVTA